MAWVVSKIIGDGKSTATAFRTAAQEYGAPLLILDYIPVDPKTGLPLAAFATMPVADGLKGPMSVDPGICVLPDAATPIDKVELTNKLAAQGCTVNLSLASTGADALSAVQSVIVVSKIVIAA